MFRLAAILALCLLGTNAYAEPQLQRVRGTVEAANDNSVTVKTPDGQTQEVQLAADTAFVWIEKSSLDQVTDGKFIGTATKGDNPPVAIELVIFPAEMKGTGEGHYAWDAIPDSGKGPTKSSMTNGTVRSSLTKSSMTNGTIKSGSSSGGKKTINVTFDGGKSLKIDVPPSAPIVEFKKADKSIVTKGAKLFSVTVVDNGKLIGKLVAIGKDITPPM